MKTIGPVVLFGELLMRLDTPDHRRFPQSSSFQATFTGGEANVGVALSQWGIPAKLVSAVPKHDLGDACLNHFRQYGVSTSEVLRMGERLGLLFVENGTSLRGSKVIYDRLNTSFRSLQPGQIDWPDVLSDASWLHVTGTAPACGANVREVLNEAFAFAREWSVPISFDCAYRSALWSEDEAAAVFPEIVKQVDVLIGSEDDAKRFLGVDATGEESLHAVRETYDLRCVTYTERDILPTGVNRYRALAACESEVCRSETFEFTVIDRIGSGDALVAGLIRGLLCGHPIGETLDFAAAAAAFKHSIPGDFLLCSSTEIERLARGVGIGRVQR
ncbi:MAG: sugar kinase [Planctomycetaceae bacterium]|nr:sugar kinase [Planctomycetaceae bacterium]